MPPKTKDMDLASASSSSAESADSYSYSVKSQSQAPPQATKPKEEQSIEDRFAVLKTSLATKKAALHERESRLAKRVAAMENSMYMNDVSAFSVSNIYMHVYVYTPQFRSVDIKKPQKTCAC